MMHMMVTIGLTVTVSQVRFAETCAFGCLFCIPQLHGHPISALYLVLSKIFCIADRFELFSMYGIGYFVGLVLLVTE